MMKKKKQKKLKKEEEEKKKKMRCPIEETRHGAVGVLMGIRCSRVGAGEKGGGGRAGDLEEGRS